ncbi:porin family protein [Winogradskyella sp.]|uniref:porin family protein n=1 Tax=Winogradskyella sp. TaxID=1883156 RepID=UPI0025E0441F|nr:porin family protein [Winogradskyella sp.]
MKKLFLCAAVAVFAFTSVSAQNFGAKAGVDLASAKVEVGGASATASETGFYVGVFAQIEISEEFAFQPEVMYVSIKDGGEIHIPLMANYSVSEEFSVLAGPALGILTETADGFSSFNYGIEAGAAYDITEEFLVEARYSLGLANLVEDAPSGVSSKLNGFYIGVGYKF